MSLLAYLEDELLMDGDELLVYAKTAPHRYKKYTIPKRNSRKVRAIAQPSKELKFIQRAVIEYLESMLPIHESATAYRKGISIRNNAQLHVDGKYLLKMDFKDFFPSITPRLFFNVASNVGVEFSGEDKELIANLLFYKMRRNSPLRLSIGAPSSPFISNFVMWLFDNALNNGCKGKKVVYSRYADDLTFSTNVKDNLYQTPKEVEVLLKLNTYGNIKINKEKTVYSSKGHNRHVTGITLANNNQLSIGRERKRLISSMIHNFKYEKLQPQKIEELKGLLAFAKHIEPTFYERMNKKYGQQIVSFLVSWQVG